MFRASMIAAAVALFSAAPSRAAEPAEVIQTYADIARAGYEDSLAAARGLRAATDALVAAPGDATLAAARAAWIRARVPYQQTEVYRFGNPLVDAWEGRVNAWPLDEGLIDYVDADLGGNDENPWAMANVIANPRIEISGVSVDATEITPDLLRSLQEIDGIEANVATGYHAIEFLLWGQDLNGVEHGAGARPATDFDPANCTGGACDRRVRYLTAAVSLLVADLEDAVAMWADDGPARAAVMADPAEGLRMAFTGMGSLSYGEQAGDRMKLGLLLHDPEEEHDCFSDNTHNSHYYNGLAVRNVWLGRYVRIDGTVTQGPSPRDLIAARDPALADRLSADIDTTMAALGAIKTVAEAGTSYDQMLAPGAASGALIQAGIDALVAQTRDIERVMIVAGLEAATFEGAGDSGASDAVFK